MTVTTGYMYSQNYGYNTQQIYRVALKILDSTKVKFGGFNYSPVIFKIPSGYARTGAYISQYASDNTDGSQYFFIGVCNFDTLGDRVQPGSNFYYAENVFVAVCDTGEFILVGSTSKKTVLSIELLDPLNLNPIGFMIWQSEDNLGVFLTQNSVTQGSIATILPEPIRTGDTVKVSRAYFSTPLGLATTRFLYSGNVSNTGYGLSLQIGNRKFISVGPWYIDITDEV
jgi:hypothetical protein